MQGNFIFSGSHLTESSYSVIRRLQYRAFEDALAKAYPDMLWETEGAKRKVTFDSEFGLVSYDKCFACAKRNWYNNSL